MNFEDCVAIVTGGASGIGFATVYEFLKNGIKNISFFDINEEAGNEAVLRLRSEFKQANIIFNRTDISKENEVEESFLKTINMFKKINILVNNAAIGGDKIKIIDINLKGMIICSEIFKKYTGKHNAGNGGIIISLSSILSIENLMLSPIYNASKIGILSYVVSYGQAYHFEKTGIKYICLCPGSTGTTLHNAFAELLLEDSYWSDVDLNLEPTENQEPENVGKAVVYLLDRGENGSVWLIDIKGLSKVITKHEYLMIKNKL